MLLRLTKLLKLIDENMNEGNSLSFGMAAVLFLCNGTLLFQGNLPRVLPVTILKYAGCLIRYIVSFLFLCGEWSSLVFKDFQKYFCFLPNVFIFLFTITALEIVCYCYFDQYLH